MCLPCRFAGWRAFSSHQPKQDFEPQPPRTTAVVRPERREDGRIGRSTPKLRPDFSSLLWHLLGNFDTRNGITEGYGKLLPDVFYPNTVEASNLADWETANGFQGDRTVSMPIPTSGRLYHVVIGDFVGYLQ